MRANSWSIATLAILTVVLTASSATAQREPDQASLDSRSLSEALDRTRLVAQDDQLSEDQEPARTILGDVARDFGRFFTTRDSGIILGLGLAGSLGAWPFDADIRQRRFDAGLLGHEGDRLDDVFGAGNHLGSTLVQVGGSFATYTIGRLAGKSDIADLGRDLVRAQLLSGGVTQILKHTVRRTRPAGSGSSRTSFPSGHTSGTFATATVLGDHYGWKVRVPALGLASYVAASRVVDNSHFLSDVVFGAAIGMAAGRAVTIDSGTLKLRVSPMPVERGIAVLVSVEPGRFNVPAARRR